MKCLLFISLLFAALCAFSQNTIKGNVIILPDVANVIFIHGQSNAGGRGNNLATDPWEIEETSNIKIWNHLSFDFENLNIGSANNGAGAGKHGIELELAQRVREKFPEQTYMVKYGVGGASIQQLSLGGALFNGWINSFVSPSLDTLFARYESIRVFHVWMQGESNSTFSGVASYPSAFSEYRDTMRGWLGDAPIIAMNIIESNIYDVQINDIFRNINEANFYNVECQNNASNDNVHYNYYGLKSLTSQILTKIELRGSKLKQ